MVKEDLCVEITQGIETITINRPKSLNALNLQILGKLYKTIKEFEADDQLKVLVITGVGNVFSAGADVREVLEENNDFKRSDFMVSFSRHLHDCFLKIIDCNKPVIAAINGLALGGGLELAMACHYRVSSDQAVFGQPEINLGAIPAGGAIQTLSRLIGKSAAIYYLLTGENITAQDGYRLGLVDKLVSPDTVMATALSIARVITEKAPIAIKLIVEGVNRGYELDSRNAFRLEEDLWRTNGGTRDFQNGIEKFCRKKKRSS